MLRIEELEYELPERLIATLPAPRRDGARMLVTGRGAAAGVRHRTVRDLPEHLRPGDVLVFNTTRVIPARLLGVRKDSGGRVEGLYLGEGAHGARGVSAALRWRVLLKGKRLRTGCVVGLEAPGGSEAWTDLVLESEGTDGPGSWIVRVEGAPGVASAEILTRVGRTPLPPYILGARKRAGIEVEERADRERYQTVYARAEEGSSVAAPTAGLHFTPELLAALSARGVLRAEVTLHVGTGTFKPVETATVEEHPMHAEWCRGEPGALRTIREARARGGRVIAVGTTAARALESLAGVNELRAAEGLWTRLLVTPGYSWSLVDGLLTNFHLPRSTLMALVAALLEGGAARLCAIYREAVGEGYRFYSYGDAMLVEP